MITSTELARQMAVYSYVTKTKKVSSIADMTGLSPLQVTNAVFSGERLNLFTVKRDKRLTIDKIDVLSGQYHSIALVGSNFGEAVENLSEQIIEFISNRNSVHRDVEEGTLLFLARVPDVMFTVALEVVKASKRVHVYQYSDPLDKKSIYTYYTLTENKDNGWYLFDFKKTKK